MLMTLNGLQSYLPAEDPGVVSVTAIYNYYKRHGHRTEVMGASFRNLDEICELAGCDLLTIGPKLIADLKQMGGELPRKLDAEAAARMSIPKIDMSAEIFARMHAEDRMSTDKLAEGIAGFSKAMVALEKLLGMRLRKLEGKERMVRSAEEVFGIYDLDGDGMITREEWGGTDAVFDALDVNDDGSVSPEELAAGLGAAYTLS